jgi:hypothetical protein
VNKSKFLHPEAFRLMTYLCESCGFVEQIWNSRDGVTPFCIGCRHCGKLDATHINWQNDQFLPEYSPAAGERVFIDFPESLKAVVARRRVHLYRGTEFEVVKEREAEYIQGIIASIQPGSPYLLVMP